MQFTPAKVGTKNKVKAGGGQEGRESFSHISYTGHYWTKFGVQDFPIMSILITKMTKISMLILKYSICCTVSFQCMELHVVPHENNVSYQSCLCSWQTYWSIFLLMRDEDSHACATARNPWSTIVLKTTWAMAWLWPFFCIFFKHLYIFPGWTGAMCQKRTRSWGLQFLCSIRTANVVLKTGWAPWEHWADWLCPASARPSNSSQIQIAYFQKIWTG